MSSDSPLSSSEPFEATSDESLDPLDEDFDDGVLYDDEVAPEDGILGFTVRELLIVGVWVLSFVLSFFPLGGGLSLWNVGIEWLLPVGVPAVAVFLLVLRRFSPDGIRRVGSLGIDQFASVAFSVSAAVWVGSLWLAISAAVTHGIWTMPWYGVLQVLTALALVVLTVFAPLIPGLKEDFHGRLVTLAHRNANPVRPVRSRRLLEQGDDVGAAVIDGYADDADSADMRDDGEVAETGADDRAPADAAEPDAAEADAAEPVTSVEPAVSAEPVEPTASAEPAQPFWILAPTDRDVHDARGDVLFRIGPTAWALVIEDRGGAYVVRHDDGRIGYLHDISDITKG